MTRTCLVMLALLASGTHSRAQGLPWMDPAGGAAVSIHPPGKLAQGAVAEVRGEDRPSAVTVLIVDDPRVPSHHYQLRARVKYENVVGDAFLEMWSQFPDGGQFFSRTLADTGPMGKITGSGDWRVLILPFFSKPGYLPNKIWVNVVLPGKGTVYLTPFEMGQATGLEDTSGWWTERQAGLIGGLSGGLLGTLGAAIGVLSGLGLARRFTLGICWACIAVGGLSLGAGLVAIFLRQPWHVWFPPVLLGLIATTVCGCNLPVIHRRYQQLEMRKMSAMDV